VRPKPLFGEEGGAGGGVIELVVIGIDGRNDRTNELDPRLDAFVAVPAEAIGASPPQRAALLLAFSFFTWRLLVRDGGLSDAQAADMMTRLVLQAR